MSTVLRALILSALLTLVPVGIGVVVANDSTPERRPVVYKATELSDFDSSAAVVQRVPFCELVPAKAVKAALEADAKLTSYGNGEDSAALPGDDVAHEYGCRFATGKSAPAEARAWVFAPPVVTNRAKRLVASARTQQCKAQADAPAYGEPSVALVCTGKDVRTASYRGLFGDAWLTCSLTLPAGVPEADLVTRAGRWCVAVAEAASATTSAS